jgi:hypothetical protein
MASGAKDPLIRRSRWKWVSQRHFLAYITTHLDSSATKHICQ